MANALRDHVIFVDTAAITKLFLSSEDFKVVAIRFVPAAGTDDCIVQNGSGETLWASGESASVVPQESRIPIKFAKGIIVPTLTGGHLYLYLALDDGSY